MIQYVIQILIFATPDLPAGWLAKNFEVTPERPIPPPEKVPADREQIVLTNTASFNSISTVYDEYKLDVLFSHTVGSETIDCSGAVIDSWPIN